MGFPQYDLEVIDREIGASCGSCHRPIKAREGVTFGRPGFVSPGINVCRKCIQIAYALLGPDAITPNIIREGNV
jgi:hypothetical protein